MPFGKALWIAALAVLGLTALYTVAGFWLLPTLAERQLPQIINDLTGQTARFGAVRFDPFTLRAELDDFELIDASGANLVAFKTLTVDADGLASLQRRGIVLSELRLLQPVLAIERRADGSFNVAEAMPKTQAATQTQADDAAQPLAFWLDTLAIDDGRIHWRDRLSGADVTETLTAVNIALTGFATQDAKPAPFTLGLQVESGGQLALSGTFDLALLASQGDIKLNGLPLARLVQILPLPPLPLSIAQGTLDLATRYQLALPALAVDLRFDQGTLAIERLAVSEVGGAKVLAAIERFDASDIAVDVGKQQLAIGRIATQGGSIEQLAVNEAGDAKTLVAIERFDVSGIAVDVGKQQLGIGRVASQGGTIEAWLQADGRLNYQALFARESPAASVQPPAPPVQPWQVAIDDVAIKHYRVNFTDQTLKKPQAMVLSDMNIGLQHFSSDQTQAVPLHFSARLNQAGQLKLGGNTRLSPFAADWAIELAAIDLKPFQGYIDPFVQLDLIDGRLYSQGHLLLKPTDAQTVYQGNARIDDLVTRDQARNRDFVKWQRLAIEQMVIDVGRQHYRFGNVALDQPYLRFNIKEDGTTNIDDIWLPRPGQPPVKTRDKTKPGKTSPEPVISIGKIAMRAGESDFADHSLILPFVVRMRALQGEVSGFVSNTDEAAKLRLQGMVYDLATVNIEGTHRFKSGDSVIDLSFRHLPLPLVTPYMAEFAGYRIERGQMDLDLQYSIKQGRLEAQNKIFIDQLALGERIENPRAVSLPLEFAIALLKDGNDRIELDFPIRGSLDDPKFSVASLVADVLVNLVKKTVTSPFRAIAALMNGKNDYSAIAFTPGAATLSPDETGKLAGIARALLQRPRLALEIKGLAYQVQDWPAMRTRAVTDILKRMKSGELRDRGENIPMEYIELSASDYRRLLAKFYAEVFPGEIDYTLLGEPRMKNNPAVEFYSTALMQLEAIMQPDTLRMNDLAVERANQIAKYLIDVLGIARSRIFVLATDIRVGDRESPLESLLSLNVLPHG